MIQRRSRSTHNSKLSTMAAQILSHNIYTPGIDNALMLELCPRMRHVFDYFSIYRWFFLHLWQKRDGLSFGGKTGRFYFIFFIYLLFTIKPQENYLIHKVEVSLSLDAASERVFRAQCLLVLLLFRFASCNHPLSIGILYAALLSYLLAEISILFVKGSNLKHCFAVLVMHTALSCCLA